MSSNLIGFTSKQRRQQNQLLYDKGNSRLSPFILFKLGLATPFESRYLFLCPQLSWQSTGSRDRTPPDTPISPTKCRRSSLERLISFYDSCRNSRKLSESTTYQTILWEVVSKGKLLSFKMKTRHNPVVILGNGQLAELVYARHSKCRPKG